MSSSSDMDVLTDLLQRSSARGAAFSRTTAHGDWGLRFGGGAALAVHVVAEGEVHLWTTRPEQAVRLLPGDIAPVREPAAQDPAPGPRPGREVPPGGGGHGPRHRGVEPHEPGCARGRPAHHVLLRRLPFR